MAKIYVGPSIPRGFMRTGQVYTNGFPTPVVETIKIYPEVRQLIVETAEYQRSLNDLKDSATRIGIAYRSLINKLSPESNHG